MPRDDTHLDALASCASWRGDQVIVQIDGREVSLPVFDRGDGRMELKAPAEPIPLMAVLKACEALTNWNAEEVLIILKPADWGEHAAALVQIGAAVALNETELGVFPELLWQISALWLIGQTSNHPQTMMPGPHGRHPHRPAKPQGEMYRRYIPWLDQRFSLRALVQTRDLDLFHRWMNDERVAAFFDEAGTLDEHRAYLARMAADPHMMPVLGCLDDEPFCYFELYWARENRIGAHYDAGAWDRGWHVLVGDPTKRGADYITAWLPSLMHFMFLAEPRTQVLVGEPAASHTQQIRNLTRSGFAKIKDFDFPHKRATLVQLDRDYFFKSRLWARPDPADPGKPLQLSLSSLYKTGATI
ncbi:GNAT family N-acetyltransferase [Loktanella agnita]|uniref:GNAT family N-acetyltransferase n=1 Tax=Loktanella agnita TaxID=287097 RepID=UPI003986D42C